MKSSLLESRKFWLMICDLVASVTIYFVTKYAAPDIAKDILFLIGIAQPVVISVIASITVQNIAHIKAASVAAETKAFVTNIAPPVVADKVIE